MGVYIYVWVSGWLVMAMFVERLCSFHFTWTCTNAHHSYTTVHLFMCRSRYNGKRGQCRGGGLMSSKQLPTHHFGVPSFSTLTLSSLCRCWQPSRLMRRWCRIISKKCGQAPGYKALLTPSYASQPRASTSHGASIHPVMKIQYNRLSL